MCFSCASCGRHRATPSPSPHRREYGPPPRPPHDHPTIDHAEPVGVEADVIGKTVRTVTGQIDWPFAVQLCAFQMDNRDRYLHTIGSDCENALDLISRAVVTAGYLILLQQLGNPFRHVILKRGPAWRVALRGVIPCQTR